MKILKKLLLAIIIVLATIVITENYVPEIQSIYTVQAASIKLNKTKQTMNVKEKITLKLKGTKKKVKWSTSNKKVATVDSKGKVTAKKKGTAKITAKVGNKKYTCKIKVENPKLNAKSKTISVTESYQFKISGTSQSIKWSSSNKNVATVNSKGKVTGKGVGTATITAKVGSTKYTATLKVLAYPYEKKISVTYKRTATSVIAFLKNNNSVALSIYPEVVFFNANNAMIDMDSDANYCFEPGATIAMEFTCRDSNYNPISFTNFKLNMGTIRTSYYTGSSNKISVTSNKVDKTINFAITNKSGKSLDTIGISVVYYDINGNTIGYDYLYADCKINGSTDYRTITPYDNNYNDLNPHSYTIYVDHAYAYNN